MRPLASLAFFLAAAPALATELHDPSSPLMVEPWVKGGPINLAEGRGKQAYVLLFFRTNCPHCRKAIPIVSQMQKAYGDLGITFAGITAEKEPVVRKFLGAWADKVSFNVGLDIEFATNTAYMIAYGDPGVPYAFVIDKTGTIVWRGHPLHGLEKRIRKMFPAAADRPWVSLTAAVTPTTQPGTPAKPAQFASGIRFDKVARIPVNDTWRTTLKTPAGVSQWLAVRATFPATFATVHGGASSLQTIHCNAKDWTLVGASGWRVVAAGMGDEHAFSGIAECTGVITHDAPQRLQLTEFHPAAAKDAKVTATPPGKADFITMQVGELTTWLYFPVTSTQATDKLLSISLRNSAPMPVSN